MRRLSACFTIVIVMSVMMFTTAIGADFRQFNWGATVKEIKAYEKIKPRIETKDRLGYLGTINNIDVNIYYHLDNGRLCGGGYINTGRHSNKNDYIEDYNSIKYLMMKKYGEPFEDEINWKNDLFKGKMQDYGMAISVGHLEYVSKWKTERTLIVNTLNGDNYEITHCIIYFNRANIDKEHKKNEKKDLDKL